MRHERPSSGQENTNNNEEIKLLNKIKNIIKELYDKNKVTAAKAGREYGLLIHEKNKNSEVKVSEEEMNRTIMSFEFSQTFLIDSFDLKDELARGNLDRTLFNSLYKKKLELIQNQIDLANKSLYSIALASAVQAFDLQK